jgi:Uma2 family endonuclease
MASAPTTVSRKPGPAWEIAHLFPDQGHISEGDYLRLTDHTRRLAEFVDGRIEVLPMPTMEHQRILLYLVMLLNDFVTPRKLGEVLMAALRVKLDEGEFREPDVLFMLEGNAHKKNNRYWHGADLVMEVVSKDDPDRDKVDKRKQYARAGISEYWIVDPHDKSIIVLRLKKDRYVTHSRAIASGVVRSALLDGFIADAAAVFAAGKRA